MNAPNFAGILSPKVGDAERPSILPIGTYVFLTKGYPRQDFSTQKKTPLIEFTCIPQGPAQNEEGENLDVDQDQLDAALTRKNGEKVEIQAKTLRLTFYITPDSEYRLHDFLKHIGFAEGDDPAQAVQESMNRQFLGYVSHEPSQRPGDDTMFARITRTAPMPE